MSKRTFIVTGGTKGIGLATVRRLDVAGHKVIANSRTMQKELIPAEFVAVDVADSVATSGAIKQLTQPTQIDGVVNDVGLVHPAALEDLTYEEFFDVIIDDFGYVRKFYADNGFQAEARIREFYAPGVDKVVFRKSLTKNVEQLITWNS